MTLEEAIKKIEELTGHVEKLNSEAKDHRLGKSKVKEDLEALQAKYKDIDPDSVRALQKKADDLEAERLKGEGKFDEALAKATADLTNENELLRTQVSTLTGDLSTERIDTAILKAIDGKAISNEQVMSLIKPHIKMEDGKPVVMDGDTPVLGDDSQRISVVDYASKFLEQNPHHVKADGGGTGSRGNNSGDRADGKTMSRTEFEALDNIQKIEMSKSGIQLTD